MMRRTAVTTTALALAVAALLAGNAAVSRALDATPVVIANEVLVRATPAAAAPAELALGRVTIMPGAAIPSHYHPGTQLAFIAQGELTYTVFTGEVLWQRATNPDAGVEAIAPGQTVVVLPGDALTETPGSIHQGRNEGAVPVVIYLSTLFPADAPRAILAEAMPTG
jgi:quercetin dioxygenase-like cupin family protein